MFAAQCRCGNENAVALPFAAKFKEDVMLVMVKFADVRLGLLLISNVEMTPVARPSKELRNVFVIVMWLVVISPLGNVIAPRFGKADHDIVSTVCRALNCKVERRVRVSSVKVPPMVPMVEDDKLVNSVAF
jgi:hypothetical protein